MRAFVIEEREDQLVLGVREYDAPVPEDDEVLIHVEYASVNFKDVMVAATPSRVRRVPVLVGGVDAAGVVARDGGGFREGDLVVAVGGPLGVARDGGFAEALAAPGRYVTALPPGLDAREAMTIGTAGYTSMASVLALEDHGLIPHGHVLVTGATGGVGSQAVHYLALKDYRPVASTGSRKDADWLRELGAIEVVDRDALSDRPDRVLGGERWDGAVDCVGGETLAQVLRALRYGAAVAASGLVAGADVSTTVYPFITRAVALLGVDAVESSPATRARVWAALAECAPRVDFARLTARVVGLGDLTPALEDVRRGAVRGRVVVDVRA